MNEPNRETLLAFEGAMREHGTPIEIETRHHFAKGLYAREIVIPSGAMISGKIHKTEHLNIVAAGKVHIVTEDFNKVIEAPATLVAFPGVKKILRAYENTVFITVHATDITDIETIEREFVTDSYLEIEASSPQLIKESGTCLSLQ